MSEDHPIAADSYIAELTDERERLLQRLEKLEGALRALLEGRGCDAIFCHLHRGREGTPSRFPPGYCPDCLARDLIDLLARQPPDTQEEERK